MGRSLWKGKVCIRELIQPLAKFVQKKQLTLKKQSNSIADFNTEIKIFRRSHQLLYSQLPVLQMLSPLFFYNGYDFFAKNTQLEDPLEYHNQINLGASIITRELNVVHKTKLSKAARRNQTRKTSKVQKITAGTTKKCIRTSLSKTIKK